METQLPPPDPLGAACAVAGMSDSAARTLSQIDTNTRPLTKEGAPHSCETDAVDHLRLGGARPCYHVQQLHNAATNVPCGPPCRRASGEASCGANHQPINSRVSPRRYRHGAALATTPASTQLFRVSTPLSTKYFI